MEEECLDAMSLEETKNEHVERERSFIKESGPENAEESDSINVLDENDWLAFAGKFKHIV